MKWYVYGEIFLAVAVFAVSIFYFAGTTPFRAMKPQAAPAASEETLAKTDKGSSMLFVGDIMLGRYVRLLSEENGLDYPFRKIADLLRSVDAVVANLEGPILVDAPRTPINGFRFGFLPESATLLKSQNVQFVSLGNNHGYDFGEDGYLQTKKYLNDAGVVSFGNAVSVDTSSAAFVDVGSQKFAFISFNTTFPSFKSDEALHLIRSIKSENIYPIVVIHWGDEYATTSSPIQQKLGHALVDVGAGIILGHHPHVVQEIEHYNGAVIFYSLGNFIFDQYFSKDVEQGLAVKATLYSSKVDFEILPIQSRHSQPALMEEPDKTIFLDELSKRSPTLSAQVHTGIFSVPL